jgi:hypothetical protein
MGQLTLALGAVIALVAVWQLVAARDRRGRFAVETARRRRADIAVAMTGLLDDPEVRDAWPMVCDAIANGWLDDPLELARRLRAGGGMQLMEETAIDIDDETPGGDRVLVYHAGFDPPRRTCPLAAFLAALDRLDATRSDTRGGGGG